MDWEADPEGPRPRGRLMTAAVIVVVVATIAWLARSPATAPDQLAIDALTPTAPSPQDSPTDDDLTALLGLDAVLPVRPGVWRTVPPPPPGRETGPLDPAPLSASVPGGPPPAHVWDGDELVRIDGGVAQAFDPVAETWRELPGYPGNPSAIKSLIALADGVAVVDMLVGPEPGAISSGALWQLGPQDRWHLLPRPPTDRVASLVDHEAGVIATGPGGPAAPDGSGVAPPSADGAWLLRDGNGGWDALPALPTALSGLRAYATVAGVVVLGVVVPPELDVNVVAAGELGAEAYLLDAAGSQWLPLAPPPPELAAGSPPVAISAAGGGDADRIVMLEASEPTDVLRVHTYDVTSDVWSAQDVDLPSPASSVVGGFPLVSSWDGAGTAWFRSTAEVPLQLALDVASGRLDQVDRAPGGAPASTPIAFPGGLLLAGGTARDAGGVPIWSDQILRWTAARSD